MKNINLKDLDLDLDLGFDDFELLDPFDEDYFIETSENCRVIFNLETSFERLQATLKIPQKNESIRMMSPRGGWSSCSLTMWIANNTVIKNLIVTTLRVGKKEIDRIADLKQQGKILNAHFIMGDIAKYNKTGKKDYNYSGYVEEKCRENNIKISYAGNHSKVILCNTDNGKLVIETSNNFNENPKIEQFIMTNSDRIYEYYIKVLSKLDML